MPTGAPDVGTLLTTAAGTFQTSAMSTLTTIVPVILTIAAVIMAVRFGLRWFKKVGKG